MRRKGVVLVVVIGVLIVVLTLALVAMYLMTQDARVAEHKIRRMRGLFAARAGMVHALEQARSGNANYTCGAGQTCGEQIRIGTGVDGYPGPCPGNCPGIPVNIVYHGTANGPMNTHQIDITVDYANQ